MTTETDPQANDQAAPGAGDDTGAAEPDASAADVKPAADPGATDGFGAAANADADAPEFGESYLTAAGQPDLSKIAERLKAVDEADAARAEQSGQVPETAQGYAEVLKDLDLPDGLQGEFKADDPLIEKFFEGAKAAGKGLSDVKAELEMFSQGVASTVKQLQDTQNEALNAEFAKVGDERFAAAKAAAKVLGGDESGEAYAAALDGVTSASTFELIEALIHQINGGGAAPPGKGANGADAKAVDPATRMAQIRAKRLEEQRT